MSGWAPTEIPPDRRILVPRNVSLNEAGECAQRILRLGSESMEPLLLFPNAGSAGFNGTMMICDALGLCSAPTLGLAMGHVMNTGCLILQACTTRLMSRYAQIEFSEYTSSLSISFGPREDLATVYDEHAREEMEGLAHRQEHMRKVLVGRSTVTAETRKWLPRGATFFNAEESLESGLVDQIL